MVYAYPYAFIPYWAYHFDQDICSERKPIKQHSKYTWLYFGALDHDHIYLVSSLPLQVKCNSMWISISYTFVKIRILSKYSFAIKHDNSAEYLYFLSHATLHDTFCYNRLFKQNIYKQIIRNLIWDLAKSKAKN